MRFIPDRQRAAYGKQIGSGNDIEAPGQKTCPSLFCRAESGEKHGKSNSRSRWSTVNNGGILKTQAEWQEIKPGAIALYC